MAGKTRFLVNARFEETRVAILEDNRLSELYIERHKDKGLLGNLYKGKVIRVLPGMEAAFVDIGEDRTAFLHVDEILSPKDQFHVSSPEESFSHPKRRRNFRHQRKRDISQLLKEGDDVLVQVSKNPIGTKGARLTCHISLPGRYLVLMPTTDHVGISRHITNEEDRKNLKQMIEDIRPAHMGLIVRTVSGDQQLKSLKADLSYLMKIWKKVETEFHRAKPVSLIHEELDLPLRIIRDRLNSESEVMFVDSKEVNKNIVNFIRSFNPKLKKLVKLHTLNEEIFDVYGIEKEIDRALGRKVWLKSGGYLIIDQVEALTVIDVNTGRFVGKKNLEQTLIQTNLEAADEVARQLRLRNCSGIIIVDFIDMEDHKNREKLYKSFEEALTSDKAQTHLLNITELGLAQMTRKRTSDSLLSVLCEPCVYCDGRGFLKNVATISLDIWKEFKKKTKSVKTEKLLIRAHPDVIEEMKNDKETQAYYAKATGKEFLFAKEKAFHREQFEIIEISMSQNDFLVSQKSF
ncbi:MAG: Rne/Rng family ribonuclease [Deltaproteobacteria bacterium]|nr:Rne/Rng family ribonuclease [Deltaproteobacteria bacterium]